MENKKRWNKIFFQDFKTLILAKKKRDEKKIKKRKKRNSSIYF